MFACLTSSSFGPPYSTYYNVKNTQYSKKLLTRFITENSVKMEPLTMKSKASSCITIHANILCTSQRGS